MSIQALAALRAPAHAAPTQSAQTGLVVDEASFFGPYSTVAYVGSMAGAITGAYHGYKRNDSIGWGVGWALLGGAFWPITIPISIAQGFGQPEKK